MNEITLPSAYVIPGIRKNTFISTKHLQSILNTVCNHYQVDVQDVLRKYRCLELVYVRHVFCYWVCMNSNITLVQIGALLKRDHTTIISGRESYKNRLYTNEKLPVTLKSKVQTCKQDYSILSRLLQ